MSDARGPAPAASNEEESDLVANWVAELAERLERGEPVDLEALAAAHPERAEELAGILPAIRRMVAFGRAVTRPPDKPPSRVKGPGFAGELGTLGDFRLLREVGRGGMGIVYEAEQISLQRRVALKVLPLAAALDPRNYQRFLLEARAAACLHHTHIVPIHAVGSERGVPYYAMQFIDGCTLAQVLEQLRGRDQEQEQDRAAGGLTDRLSGAAVDMAPMVPTAATSLGGSSRDREYIRAVASHGRHVAEALDHAHGRDVLHRDIKPANLMLDAEGRLWITDFGLARIQGDSRLTLTGDILGTLRYMSPEQALARRAVIDGRTDIYSLGATLYELLALQPVFDGADRAEVLRKIAQDEPTPLRRLNPAVPRDLETIVHKTLAKEPSGRYATAQELADDLGRFLDARPIVARPPGKWEHLSKWARRNRAIVAPAVVFAATALLVFSAGLIWSNNRLIRQGEQLRIERDRAKELSVQLKSQRDLALRSERVADQHLYAFRIRQAAEALKAGKLAKAQEVLRDCRPGPGEDDPRGFAWHYLQRESRKDLAVLSERTERVKAAALSPDGRTLATGDTDGTIRLRDPLTGQTAMTLRGHALEIVHLAFSPDGRRLFSCGIRLISPTAEAALWDLGSGRPQARWDGIENVELAVFDWKSDHIWMLYAMAGQWRLGRWDVKTDPSRPRLTWSRGWERLRPPRAGDGPVAAIESAGSGFRLRDLIEAMSLGWSGPIDSEHGQVAAGSPDGRLLAVGAGPWNVVWDVTEGRERTRFANPPGQGVKSFRFSPDNRFLAIGFTNSSPCVIEVRDLRTGALGSIPSARNELPDLRLQVFSPDSRFFAWYVSTPGDTQPTRIGQLAPWREVADSSGVLLGAESLEFAPDGRSLIVRANFTAFRWNWRPSPGPSPLDGHKDEAWAVAFSNDGRMLATGGDDTGDPQTLKIWDTATGRLLRGWKPHEAMTSAVAFQPGGRIIASAALMPDANLRLWDASTGGLLATLDGHTDRVRTVAFSPDGTLLASAGSDRVIRLWDVAARRCIKTLTGHSDTIRQVAFSPDGRAIASVGNDLTARLWDVDRGEQTWSWNGSVKIAAVAFAPDGRTLAWAHEDGVVQRWDVAAREALAPLHSEYDELRCLAFSPDGRSLAAAGKSGNIHLWDPVTGQELLTLEGRPCQANALAFAPDSSALAACWHDGTVRIIRSR